MPRYGSRPTELLYSLGDPLLHNLQPAYRHPYSSCARNKAANQILRKFEPETAAHIMDP